MNFFNFFIQKSKKGGGILKIIFTFTYPIIYYPGSEWLLIGQFQLKFIQKKQI